MTAKRMAPPRKAPAQARSKTKATPLESELAESAVLVILEPSESSSLAATTVSADVRQRLIAAEAYFIAERRGFSAGHEFDDWLTAEAVVEARLRHDRAA